ncbi:Sec24-like_protein [Hexamita inflata]|uniref:Sec24-like_protein n=1 Tax=Hexamita inflata TaxID=28002 RepID=A0ABP1GIM2_9EUKA
MLSQSSGSTIKYCLGNPGSIPYTCNIFKFCSPRMMSSLVERAPVRCKRCKAYLNKFNKLLPTEYSCCICGRVNELPDHFKQEVDGQLVLKFLSCNTTKLRQVEYVVEDLQYLHVFTSLS